MDIQKQVNNLEDRLTALEVFVQDLMHDRDARDIKAQAELNEELETILADPEEQDEEE